MLRSSLSNKFGGLYALLILLFLGLGFVVLANLEDMTRDAEQVLEESREFGVVSRMHADAETLVALIEALPAEREFTANESERLFRLTDRLAADLEKMRTEQDPSRTEHQDDEDEITRVASQELRAIRTKLSGPQPRRELGSMLEEVRVIQDAIGTLGAETAEEVEHAERDFAAHVEWTRRVTLYSVVIGSLVLCGALLLVFRGVVAPLRKLQAGAQRFGEGDLLHRIDITSRDEVGLLASTFNEMAERISRTRFELENRVRERTGEFIRAARLADLGVFAAGIAHEINTPLASIVSCADGLSRKLEKRGIAFEEGREYLATISTEAFRAREITTRLLALAGQGGQELAMVDLRLVLGQVRTAVEHLLEKRSIELRMQLHETNRRLHIDAGELVQVLVNLILNAADASERGGTIELRYQFELERIWFEVEDHGTGIAAEDLDRIFEPFFTTKGPREGTGLGLALVSALVEARNGSVRVESRVGEGTQFRIEIPIDWKDAQ